MEVLQNGKESWTDPLAGLLLVVNTLCATHLNLFPTGHIFSTFFPSHHFLMVFSVQFMNCILIAFLSVVLRKKNIKSTPEFVP